MSEISKLSMGLKWWVGLMTAKTFFMDDLNGATKLNKIQLACVPFLSYGHSMAFMIDIGSFRHILWSYYIQVITYNTCPEYGYYSICVLRSELYCHTLGLIFNFLFRLEALVVPGSLNKRCGLFNLGKKSQTNLYSVVGKSANLNILMASHLNRTFLEKH